MLTLNGKKHLKTSSRHESTLHSQSFLINESNAIIGEVTYWELLLLEGESVVGDEIVGLFWESDASWIQELDASRSLSQERETIIASKMVTEEVLLYVEGAVWNKY